MNRYDFVQVIDIDDNSHYYTVFASNYEQAFNAMSNQLNGLKYEDFRVDVYENVQMPLILRNTDAIIEHNNDFCVDKLQNSSHKEQFIKDISTCKNN